MKKLSALLALVVVFLTATGFSDYSFSDKANVLDQTTRQLISEKNSRYLQTKEEPQIIVKTVKRTKKLTPKNLDKKKRTVYIVVGVNEKNKKNVQIFSTKDLHSSFTATVRSNIIRAAVDDLRSTKKDKFNEGIRFVFRAVATKIDQRYNYSLDKYDLNDSEMNKISHPHSVALPLALGIVVIIAALSYLFKQTRLRQSRKNENQK
ncbi:TPM domain-containing protein [Lactobacillus corticis]|uniref:TPM domain-containing protein n=1 Tax=Lactobacillus corticis TaxID=2201249 RepID=A0A916QIS3_9LACO|nr:hypothetical protein LCB40_07670 [Lactobacillus corticis]